MTDQTDREETSDRSVKTVFSKVPGHGTTVGPGERIVYIFLFCDFPVLLTVAFESTKVRCKSFVAADAAIWLLPDAVAHTIESMTQSCGLWLMMKRFCCLQVNCKRSVLYLVLFDIFRISRRISTTPPKSRGVDLRSGTPDGES